ncbi:uncharacterized protein ACA1_109590 [Acanthamoeba castellanii str. Neff]|uniref:Uncharacterized protein n=1 Tax=Acanthamoeba castellanii (strain ATCC 30010 / Neff) TaxID=1257118 RepID=L8HBZ2_ACACF|nr:uncharacterized protein ACA1_109590 [Acanthamoeba castellanii str. Neff]ELR22705.1 hypothetical protein ACA1_109590 [Acanthamoeba castellanii str. Neff]
MAKSSSKPYFNKVFQYHFHTVSLVKDEQVKPFHSVMSLARLIIALVDLAQELPGGKLVSQHNFEIDSKQDWEVWPQAKKSTARLNLLLYIAWRYLV